MEQTITQVVQQLYPDQEVSVELTRPEPNFGDYATNIALRLARPLGKSPRHIAEEIVAKLAASDSIDTVEVAGPGFINIRLGGAGLLALTKKDPLPDRAGQTIVAETNNPNPFKAMHIGHAMNAIVGDTIANLLAVDGARVYRVSYHGDIGLHVGKSMYSLLEFAGGNIEKIRAVPAPERNSFMSKMYAAGSKAYKDDAVAKKTINDLAEQSFAPKTSLYADIYELCKAWSFEQIDATVKQLGNQPTVYRFLESDADARGVKIVEKNTPGVFKKSDGAYIFAGSQHGSFDNVFVASNGHGLYGARDLGLMQLKNEQFHPDKSYIVTGAEQGPYFKGVIAAAGLIDPAWNNQTVNIPTGLVKLTTGKMSSRDGDVIEISWLFEEFKKAIEARGGEASDEIIAGALRYQFLKVKIGSDVVFDVHEAVSLTGNTGSYLQYAHARARRILEKVSGTVAMPTDVRTEDRSLVRKLGQYAETVELSTRTLEPHHIANYLFELAQEFNRYYEKTQVVGDALETHRAGLVSLYADTLRAGLLVLGIHAPETM